MTAEPTRLVYFSWVRERIGVQEERRTLPATVKTAADLVAWVTRIENAQQRPIERLEDVSVPESQNREALALQPSVAAGVLR
jgi:molybdopterin converting factor small subunit